MASLLTTVSLFTLEYPTYRGGADKSEKFHMHCVSPLVSKQKPLLLVYITHTLCVPEHLRAKF